MKIYFDTDSNKYTNKAKLLKNAVTVDDGNNKFYYEFELGDKISYVFASDNKYIVEACDFYQSNNLYINKISAKDNSFYKEYDYTYTFKLPVNILQPSAFFLKKSKLDSFEGVIDDDLICIHVAIINDEYVVVDGHHRLRYLIDNDYRMVNVCISKITDITNDLVYIAKEQNIRSVKIMEELNDDDYHSYLESINNLF